MNFFELHLPYLLSLGILAIVLLLREHQNAVIQKSLIDRLLVAHGHEPLPDIEPIAEITGEAKKADIADKIEEAIAKIKRQRNMGQTVRFNIPNMGPQPKAGMGEVKRG